MCQGLVSPYFSRALHLLDKSQPLQSLYAEGALIRRWGDSKKGGWRWTSQRQETWRPGDFSVLFQLTRSIIFVCTRLGIAVRGSAWIWRLSSHPVGTRHYRSKRGAHLLAHPPQLPQPHPIRALGPKAAQSPEM